MISPVVDKNKVRRLIVFSGAGLCVLMLLYFIWAVSIIWAPIIVGAMLAYLFRPLQSKFQISWMPHEMAVVLAFLFSVAIFSGLFFKIKSMIPHEEARVELKIRLDYKLDEKFNEVFSGSNSFLTNIGNELRPAFNSISGLLVLTPDELDMVEKNRIHAGEVSAKRFSNKYYAYYEANLARRNIIHEERSPNAILEYESTGEIKNSVTATKQESSHLLKWISIWLLCPFVFIFLIFDNGQIRRFFVSLVPNTYFELTLTLIDRVDEAVGSYLRGTAMECFLVGICMVLGLILVGVSLPVSIVLGLFCGLINAVPFLGPTIGALILLGYALIAEQIHPLLPYMTLEHLPFACMALVGFVQFLDNICFAPIVLGRAVNLHPLVVILSLASASMLFGIMGLALTIPMIVIVKTIATSLFTQLKAYKLI